MKPALLVIDVQRQFFKHGAKTCQSLQDAIQVINAATALFREKHLPIICVQMIDEKDGVVPGEIGFELPDELNVLTTDMHLQKHYDNSFNKTGLEDQLRQLGVDTVIVTGYCAEYCVLSTYRGAVDRDLKALILRGAMASDVVENIRFVESICETTTYGALNKDL